MPSNDPTPRQTCGMIDARCENCGRTYGWAGRVVDCPPCPSCGCDQDRTRLELDQQMLDDFRELLAELRTANPGWDKWQRARVAAGLTLRQAAELIGLSPTDLSAIERGESKPTADTASAMRQVYCGDWP